MNRMTAATLFTSLCLAALPVLAQDKTKSQPSGQEKIQPTPGTQAPTMGTPAGSQAGSQTGSQAGGTMADHPAMGMKHHAKMDTNGDGVVSKAEFTKHHEAMWAGMKKNAKGQVSVTDMDSQMMAK